MKLVTIRYNSAENHTNGALLINGHFACYTLEDEYRSTKLHSETRIPDGTYQVRLRTEGGFHQKYLKRFGPDFHKGMLQIMDVPNFEFILIHIGNSDKDTAGCLLVGNTNDAGSNFIKGSQDAYLNIYPPIRDALLSNERVEIEIITVDSFKTPIHVK